MAEGKKLFRNIVMFFFVILFFISGFFFLSKGNSNTKRNIIYYSTNNNIDYKVYLKKNNFFDEPYLEKNGVYITSIIKDIDTDFVYDFKSDNKISGKYTYSIKAIMTADTQDDYNKKYWTKEYVLLDEKSVEYSNENELYFTQNIKIDYQKYNDLLMQFKKNYQLSMTGTLKVYLDVKNEIYGVGNDKKLIKESKPSISIPLTKATIEVPIDMNFSNDKSALSTNIIKDSNNKYTIYRLISIVSFVLSIIMFISFIYLNYNDNKKTSKYKIELRKILKTYDDIIVNINNISTDDMNVVDVKKFEELIDSYNNLRLPICFFETRKTATFILITDKIAFRYMIRKDDNYD